MELKEAGDLYKLARIEIPADVLFTPGALTDEDLTAMRMHPVYSSLILKAIPSFSSLSPIVRAHHERWDGSGYPDGLRGRAIPLASRIIAIADMFDSLFSDSPLRKGLGWETASQVMADGKGTYFDPDILEIFLQSMAKIFE